jgi:hypothetical protein
MCKACIEQGYHGPGSNVADPKTGLCDSHLANGHDWNRDGTIKKISKAKRAPKPISEKTAAELLADIPDIDDIDDEENGFSGPVEEKTRPGRDAAGQAVLAEQGSGPVMGKIDANRMVSVLERAVKEKEESSRELSEDVKRFKGLVDRITEKVGVLLQLGVRRLKKMLDRENASHVLLTLTFLESVKGQKKLLKLVGGARRGRRPPDENGQQTSDVRKKRSGDPSDDAALFRELVDLKTEVDDLMRLGAGHLNGLIDQDDSRHRRLVDAFLACIKDQMRLLRIIGGAKRGRRPTTDAGPARAAFESGAGRKEAPRELSEDARQFKETVESAAEKFGALLQFGVRRLRKMLDRGDPDHGLLIDAHHANIRNQLEVLRIIGGARRGRKSTNKK